MLIGLISYYICAYLKLCSVILFSLLRIMQIEVNDQYVNSGPPFLIFLHPALGPLWEVTRQKVHSQFSGCPFSIFGFASTSWKKLSSTKLLIGKMSSSQIPTMHFLPTVSKFLVA